VCVCVCVCVCVQIGLQRHYYNQILAGNNRYQIYIPPGLQYLIEVIFHTKKIREYFQNLKV